MSSNQDIEHFIEPLKCNKCKIVMDKVEDINGVEIGYSWDDVTKEYVASDYDYYGNAEVKYVCPQCDEEIEQ